LHNYIVVVVVVVVMKMGWNIKFVSYIVQWKKVARKIYICRLLCHFSFFDLMK